MCKIKLTQVLDHYENPRNVGRLDTKSDNVGTGLVGAPACGDVMKLQVGTCTLIAGAVAINLNSEHIDMPLCRCSGRRIA
jgi:hypothetical protein